MAHVTARRAGRLPRAPRADLPLHDPTRVGVVFAAWNVLLFSLMSLAQWAGWGGLYTARHSTGAEAVTEALAVTLVNLGYGVLVIAGVFGLRPMRWPVRVRYPLVALVALVASVPRVLAMLSLHTTPSNTVFVVAEWVAGFAAGFVAVGAGVFGAQLVSQARREQQQRLEAAERAVRASEELQSEEMRVRRMVSDQLHGNLQFRLVTVTAGLDGVAARLDAAGDSATAADLREWAETLERIREQEVRSLSHAVFPAGIEIGTMPAIELMLRRLPPHVATTVEMGPVYRQLDDQRGAVLPMAERLVAVYTVEEGVTNALRHGRARSVHVRAEVHPTANPERWVLDMTVDDDGVGLPGTDLKLSGLARHSQRLQARGGSLELVPNPVGGTRLHFRLPFRLQEPPEPPRAE